MAAAKETGARKTDAVDRFNVWKAHVGEVWETKCFSCRKKPIVCAEPAGWERAHVKSRRDGGEFKIENIFPICRTCNSQCGAGNQVEWAFDHGYEPHPKMVEAYLRTGGQLEGRERKSVAANGQPAAKPVKRDPAERKEPQH